MQTAPDYSLTNKYKPRTSPWTNDSPTWSNGGARSGTYLGMIGEKYKKDVEQEGEEARVRFKKGKNGF